MANFSSSDGIINLARDTLQPALFSCEWIRCNAELNSWNMLKQHLQIHCAEPTEQGIYKCQFPLCAGRDHASQHGLLQHIQLSHLSRTSVSCPIIGCSEHFMRSQSLLPEHIRNEHTILFEGHLDQVNLKQLRKPITPSPHHLSNLPPSDMDFYQMLFLPVSRAHWSKTQKQPSSSQTTHRWVKIGGRQGSVEEQMDVDQQHFDLNLRSNTNLIDLPQLSEYILRSKPEEPMKQLSRPQYIISPPLREKTPPPSTGYHALQAQFEELERAGLVGSATGWPDHDSSSEPVSS